MKLLTIIYGLYIALRIGLAVWWNDTAPPELKEGELAE